MKIAIIVNSLEQKGPVIVAITLANQLYSQGHDITVFYLQDREDKIFTSNLPLKKLTVSEFLNFSQYQVVHSHSLLPDIYNAIQSLVFKNTSVTTIHNDIFTDLYPEYNRFKSTILRMLWRISWVCIKKKICISKSLLDSYASNIKIVKKKWFYVHNAVSKNENYILSDSDLLALENIRKIKDNGNTILGTCAVITQRKGIQYLIKAAKLLPIKHHVIIVGDGTYKEELVKLNDGNNNVTFIPRTSAPQAYMKLFDIYVMPSISEGFGLAAVEGAIEGCKLICANIPIFRELFGNESLYFELGHDMSLVNAVVKANEMPFTTLRDFAKANFSDSSISKKYLEVYQADVREN